MIFLLLQIVFSSAFTLIIKWSQQRNRDIVSIGAINYIVAAIAILPQYMQSGDQAVAGTAAAIGGTMGVCYFVAYFFVIYSIRRIGASATTVVSVLSITVPILCAAFFWDERPNGVQMIGVVLALLSLFLIGANRTRTGATESAGPPTPLWLTPVVLFGFFVLCGVSRLVQEAFRHECTSDQRPTFLFAAFGIAGVASMILLVVRRRRPAFADLLFGTALGLSNILQSHFILKAIKVFEGFVVFPATAAGGLVLTTFVATRMMDERLTRRTWTGIGLACFALMLLYYRTSVV